MSLLLVKDFIVANYSTIIFAILSIIGFAMMGKEKIKEIVVMTMLEAEKYLAENGHKKKEFVVDRVHGLLPGVLKVIINKERLGFIVEQVIEYIKEDYEKRKI